jgi:glutamate carboxypeptidase
MIAIHNLNTMFRGVTFNVTRISSNEQLNVMPDGAHCYISIHTSNEDDLD